jgi:UDP-glucuronate 4-epimerase
MFKRVFITGTAGFIGYHLAQRMLETGHNVMGYDGMTDYYDVALKRKRHSMLQQHEEFQHVEAMLEDKTTLDAVVDRFQPNIIIHLAAQAGVRYSLENPRAYIDSNIIGTFQILDAAKRLKVDHLLMASTSSVYGGNTEMPFKEEQRTDFQLTMYAATKKANESMAHAYAHLWKIPTTMFRFFTVYGTWGRPDLALFKFVDAILKDEPIDIYNNGEMHRDFTYVDDLVEAIRLLTEKPPVRCVQSECEREGVSPVAPYRVVNIGNSQKVRLLDFIEAIEAALGKQAIRNFMPMQMGDVPATHADCSLLREVTGFQPNVDYQEGVDRFVKWFRSYYGR